MRKTETVLEFDKIITLTQKFAQSSVAKAKLDILMPISQFDVAKKLLEQTNEADKILYTHITSPNFAVDDIEVTLGNAEKFSVLSMAEILRVARVLRASKSLRNCIDKISDDSIVLIKRLCAGIYCDDVLEKDIDVSIISDNEMADNASVKLKTIRTEIKRTNEKIKAKLNMYISSPTYQKYLQDCLITMRNNRYVVPVKAEYRSQIQGLVHDQSSTGATLYIEPFVVVELNNDLKGLFVDELTEIETILRNFTFKIAEISNFLRSNIDIITSCDVIFAKAKYAKETKSHCPILNNRGFVKIVAGRHPLIDSTKVVPVSVQLGGDNNLLLVTGPNTGGKTVSLKLVGLFSLMVMAGFFVPCKEGTELSVFDDIYCDIGDEQSIEQSLSTFSSHIVNIKRITDNVTKNSLVLLDEIGAGTDPSEGSALAISVVEYILSVGAKGIVTTHYNELKEFSFKTDKIENASMGFNPDNFAPTYQLLIGVAGSSNALQIATRLGLSSQIISNAKARISNEKEDFDTVLKSAEESRRKTESLNNEIELLKVETSARLKEAEQDRNFIKLQREKLEANMQKEAKALLEDYMSDAREILDKIKDTLANPTEEGLFESRVMRKKLEDLQYDKPDSQTDTFENTEIKIGDTVLVGSLNTIAEVLQINSQKSEYNVRIGQLETKVKFKDAKKVKNSNRKNIKSDTSSVFVNRRFVTAGVREIGLELNLIGKRAEESVFELDAYLDSAVLAGLSEVRIVHGKGTGALKTAVQDHLKTHYSVEAYRLGKYGEGDHGVTIVTLKKQ